MGILAHAMDWARGEIFEAAVIGLFGLVTMLIGWAFWKFGNVPTARALLIPLLAVGALFALAGASGIVNNRLRLHRFEQAHRESAAAFAASEKARVEGFQYLYTITMVLAPVFFALATALFWWTSDPRWRAAGIALVVLALSGLVIDYFSKERAEIYYAKIQVELSHPGPAE